MSQGPDVGGAWIEIHADGNGLPEEIQAVVEKAVKKVKARITLDPQLAKDWRAKVQALIAKQRNPEQPVDPTLDPSWGKKTREQTKRQKPAPVPVEPDIDKDFRARLAAQVEAATRKIEADIPLTPDGERFRRLLASEVKGLSEGIEAEIPIEPAEAAAARAKLVAQIKTLQAFADADPVKIPVEVTGAPILEKLARDLDGGSGRGGLAGSVRNALASFAALPAAIGAFGNLGTLLGGATAGVVALAGALVQASAAAIPVGAVLASLGLAAVTLKVGFSGVGDAMTAAAKASAEFAATGKVSQATADALDAALKNLSPSAREVVSALRGITQQFATIRASVQQNLFQELGPQLVQLGRTFLPLVSSSLVDFAQILNSAALDFLKFIRSGENTQRISTILQGLEPILRNILTVVKPLTDAFLRIFEKSLPFAERISTVIAGLAERFAKFIEGTTKSGAFNKFMETAFKLAGDLFGVLGNLGSILGSVFAAGTESGGGLLQLLEKLLGGLADFLKSANGKSALASFFGLISEAGSILLNTFRTLTPVFQGLNQVFSALQGPLAQLGIALGPVLATAATVIGDALKTLAPIIADLVTALTPLVAGLLSGLVTVFSELFTAITPIFPVLVQVVQALVTGLLPVLPQLVAILGNSISGFAQLVVALLPLVPSLLELIPPVTQLVVQFAALVVAILPLLNLITQFTVALLTKLMPAFTFILNGSLLVDNALAKLAEAFVNVVKTVVDFVVNVIANFQTLRAQGGGLVTSFIGAVVQAFTQLPPQVLSVIRKMISGVSGLFGDFAKTAASDAGKVASGIIKAISSGLSGLTSAFTRPFDSAKSGVAGALQSILNTVEGFVSKISGAISKIAGAISKIPGIPKIPGLAKGGVAMGPTLIGERVPELVVPVSPNAPLNPGVAELLAQVAAARAGTSTETAASAPVSVTQNITLPTGDPEAAALAVLDRLAAVL